MRAEAEDWRNIRRRGRILLVRNRRRDAAGAQLTSPRTIVCVTLSMFLSQGTIAWGKKSESASRSISIQRICCFSNYALLPLQSGEKSSAVQRNIISA